MAKKYVTRTIKTTTARCIICFTDTHEVKEESFVLSGHYGEQDKAKIVKAITSLYEDGNFVIVSVESVVENNSPYRCTEDEYLTVAKPFNKSTKN